MVNLVVAARNNDLQGILNAADLVKISLHKKHGHSPSALVELLKRIEPSSIVFHENRPMVWPRKFSIRMVTPISMDFDFETESLGGDTNEVKSRIVAVHP